MNQEPVKSSGPRHYLSLDDKEILKRAERLMKEEKRFLDPWLMLDELAAEIGVLRNALSRAINTVAGISFPLWIGRYRIAETQRLMGEKNGDKLKVNELARMSGFSSRTTFFRVCRAITGSTPSALIGKGKQETGTEKFTNK